MENKENTIKKGKKFREVVKYFWGGLIVGLDAFIIYFLYKYKSEFFNLTIDYSRSIELGILIVKLLLLIGLLVLNLKSVIGMYKEWRKTEFVKIKETKEGLEEYNRIGLIKKALFYWRVNGARKWMDKYHEEFVKMKKTIGNIKGSESKELRKLKEEMIKGILLWTEDFQITRVEYDKKGNKIYTDIPVNKEFLESLYLEDLYEDYLIKCIDTAERFINGISEYEKLERI